MQPAQLETGLKVQEKEWKRLRAYLQCAVTDRRQTEADIKELKPKLQHLKVRLAACNDKAATDGNASAAAPTAAAAGDADHEPSEFLLGKIHVLQQMLVSKQQVRNAWCLTCLHALGTTHSSRLELDCCHRPC
jgi:hypothetical protein